MIRLQDLTIGYGARMLLTDVSAVIPGGKLTALIGRNGSGKSTLLRAIAGINGHYTGEVIIDGNVLREMSAGRISRLLSFVSTSRPRIPNLRCSEVVAMGRAPYTDWIGRLSRADRDMVDHALECVGMSEFANKTMDCISDGECQRVMIARALAQDTPVILLDEPTSFLDLPNRYELCALLSRLSHEEGKCILFSTHELDIALSLCDTIALISTPNLCCMPTAEMRVSGLIDRLFSSTTMHFDSASGTIVI